MDRSHGNPDASGIKRDPAKLLGSAVAWSTQPLGGFSWYQMNGKLGDHPLNDILDHNATRFSPDIDNLVRELATLVPRYRLSEMFDWLNPPPLPELKAELQTEVDRLTEDARRRGWEIS